MGLAAAMLDTLVHRLSLLLMCCCVQAEVAAAAATVAALSGERDSHRAAAEEAVQRANVSSLLALRLSYAANSLCACPGC